MNEREFDQLLYQGAAQIPSDALPVQPPQPWRKPMSFICGGLALSSFSLNFFFLNYVLPAVGVVLLWLGFRMLRRTNSALRFAWVIATLLTIFRLSVTVLQATPLSPKLTSGLGIVLFLIGAFLTWLLYVALWQGLKEVFRSAGQPPKTRAAGFLVLWYSIMVPLAWLEVQGILLVLPILLLWIVILVCLYRTSHALDEAGYGIVPVSVRLSNRLSVILWLGITAGSILLSMLCFQHLPMDITEAELPSSSQTELREELTALGFPEELLADLTDEEVEQLKDAKYIEVSSSGPGHDLGRDIDKLADGFVMVVLPDDILQFYYWFSWTEEPESRFMDGIEIDAFRQSGYLTRIFKDYLQGRLLWEEDGRTLQATLSGEPIQNYWWTAGPFTSAQSEHDVYSVDFSLPKNGTNIRGYVTWQARPTRPSQWLNFNSYAGYTHQVSLFNYPWQTPSDYEHTYHISNDLRFPQHQSLVLFQYPGYSTEE